MAAVLAGGEGTLASHGALARLHGIEAFAAAAVEVTTPLSRQLRLPQVVAHRSRTLFDADVRVLRRIPCTSPARLVVDLSGRLDAQQLGRVVDDLLRCRRLSLRQVADSVQRIGKAPGRSPATVEAAHRPPHLGHDRCGNR